MLANAGDGGGRSRSEEKSGKVQPQKRDTAAMSDDDDLLAALEAELDGAAALTSPQASTGTEAPGDEQEQDASESAQREHEAAEKPPTETLDLTAEPLNVSQDSDASVAESDVSTAGSRASDGSAGTSGKGGKTKRDSKRALGTEPSAPGSPPSPEVVKKSIFGGMFSKDKSKAQEKPGSGSPATRPKDVQAMVKQLDQLKAEVDLHRETKDQLARELESTKRDLDDQRQTFKASIAVLSATNAKLEAELRDARSELEALRSGDSGAALVAELSSAEVIATSTDDGDRLQASTQPEEDASEPDLSRKASHDSSVGSDGPTDELEALQLKMKRFQQGARETIEALQDKIEALSDSAREAEENQEIAQLKSSRLEEEVKQVREELAGVRLQLTASSKDVETHKKLLEASKQECHALRIERDAEITASAAVKKEAKKQMEDMDLKLTWTENKLKEANDELASCKKQLAEVKQECAQVKQDYKRVSKIVGDSEQAMTKAQASIQVCEDAKAEAERLRADLEQTQKEFNEKLIREVAARENLEQENTLLVSTTESCSKALEDVQRECATLRKKVEELENEADELRERQIQAASEVAAAQAAAKQHEDIKLELQKQKEEANHKADQLRIELDDERASHVDEITYLTAQLSEESQKSEKLAQALQDCEDGKKLMQKKNAKVTKELARQLKQAQKKIGDMEAGSTQTSAISSPASSPGSSPRSSRSSSISGGLASRATSSGSTLTSTPSHHQSQPSRLTTPRSSRREFGSDDSMAANERHARLRSELEKRDERIRFYETHCADLTEDIQRKSRLLQQYLVRERAGSLNPAQSDDKKPKRGMMASVFSSSAKPSDLQLSQEINEKLQSVLEDTLLKNIQLKESMDLLAASVEEKNAEVRRLKEHIQELEEDLA